jgi:hypothetical protein
VLNSQQAAGDPEERSQSRGGHPTPQDQPRNLARRRTQRHPHAKLAHRWRTIVTMTLSSPAAARKVANAAKMLWEKCVESGLGQRLSR